MDQLRLRVQRGDRRGVEVVERELLDRLDAGFGRVRRLFDRQNVLAALVLLRVRLADDKRVLPFLHGRRRRHPQVGAGEGEVADDERRQRARE